MNLDRVGLVAALTVLLPVATVRADLLVTGRGADAVFRYDATGALLGRLADPNLVRPVGITFGPDGDIFVAAGDTEHVIRFDGTTGESKGDFVSGAGLLSPRNLNFGPDGAFYVADGFLGQILRFEGESGVFDRIFIQDPRLDGPTSFTFGPDGHVYVVSVNTNQVLRFDGASGAFIDVFVATALSLPHDVSFGPDGNLYVTNSRTGFVQRYRPDNGAWIDTFVRDPALRNPLGMTWGPDGHLYVANQGGNEVRRYDGATGASAGVAVAPGAGGLVASAFLAFQPAAEVGLASLPGAPAGDLLLAISGARPGARVLIATGTPDGSSELAECPGLAVAAGEATPVAARTADESGNAVLRLRSAAPGTSVALVALDAGRCLASAPLIQTLP